MVILAGWPCIARSANAALGSFIVDDDDEADEEELMIFLFISLTDAGDIAALWKLLDGPNDDDEDPLLFAAPGRG